MEDPEMRRLEKANPINQVAVELAIKVKGSVGRCFRADRHPAGESEDTLFFDLAGNTFFCKVCRDVGGTVVDLVGQRRGWDRNRALEWLAHRVEADRTTRELYYGKGKKK